MPPPLRSAPAASVRPGPGAPPRPSMRTSPPGLSSENLVLARRPRPAASRPEPSAAHVGPAGPGPCSSRLSRCPSSAVERGRVAQAVAVGMRVRPGRAGPGACRTTRDAQPARLLVGPQPLRRTRPPAPRRSSRTCPPRGGCRPSSSSAPPRPPAGRGPGTASRAGRGRRPGRPGPGRARRTCARSAAIWASTAAGARCRRPRTTRSTPGTRAW